MNILLTGYTGFVGKNLAAYFNDNQMASVINLNLRDALPQQLPQATAVIHLAGKAHDLKNTSDAQAYFEVNTVLTQTLFDRFLASDVRDFIYFSSVKAVADTVEGALAEDVVPSPITPYGQSKLAAEAYLLKQTLPEGKRLFIFRPCMIHGPGNKGNLNLLYKVVKKGVPYPLGAFENRRSFLSIDNLLFVIKTILNDPLVTGGIYNLADDTPLATAEVIKIIGVAIHRKPHIWKIPTALVNLLAKAGDLLSLPLNTERLQKLTESYVVDNTKIKTVLSIAILPITAKDGLLTTIKSFEN